MRGKKKEKLNELGFAEHQKKQSHKKVVGHE